MGQKQHFLVLGRFLCEKRWLLLRKSCWLLNQNKELKKAKSLHQTESPAVMCCLKKTSQIICIYQARSQQNLTIVKGPLPRSLGGRERPALSEWTCIVKLSGSIGDDNRREQDVLNDLRVWDGHQTNTARNQEAPVISWIQLRYFCGWT